MVNQMARINLPGLIYLHLLIFFLTALSVLALKDVNFSDLGTAPDISSIQGWVMISAFLGASLVLAVMFLHGFAIRHPRLGAFGVISLFLVYSALLILVGIGLYPKWFDASGTQHSYRMMVIPVVSAFIILGSLIFLVLKFSDDRERRWFTLAVRQEMESPSKVVCPVCETVVSKRAKRCYKCKTKLK